MFKVRLCRFPYVLAFDRFQGVSGFRGFKGGKVLGCLRRFMDFAVAGIWLAIRCVHSLLLSGKSCLSLPASILGGGLEKYLPSVLCGYAE